MTREELEQVIYERTRDFVGERVLGCILELIAAEQEKEREKVGQEVRGFFAVARFDQRHLGLGDVRVTIRDVDYLVDSICGVKDSLTVEADAIRARGEQMTRDDIIRLAQEAGFICDEADFIFPNPKRAGIQLELERFAALVEQHLVKQGYRKCAEGQKTTQFCGMLEAAVTAEREACAEICDGYAQARFAAKAIRARGESK